MNELTKLMQEEVSWYMLFANDIVLADEIRNEVGAS